MSSVSTVRAVSTLPLNTELSVTPDDDGALMSNVVTQDDGYISELNSTEINLAAGATFEGTFDSALDYGGIRVLIYASHASASRGLEFWCSKDGTNGFIDDSYTIPVATAKTFTATIAPYFKIRYTNGGTQTTTLKICTIFSKNLSVPSSHRIGDTVTDDDDAQLVQAVLKAQTATGNYTNVNATPERDLRVSVVNPVGVLPVAQLTTLFDGKIINRFDPDILESVGTGTGTFSNNKYLMSVTAGQYRIVQGKQFTPYFSGKPQKIEFTFSSFSPESGVTKRAGYYSSSTTSPYSATLDGVWLESANGTITLKASNAGTETISIDLADWTNYDSIAEYQTLATWDNFTVCEINFLWLGGAYIELRMMTSNGWVTATNYIYAGTAVDVFIKSPIQPIRYEIRSSTGSGSFTYICNQIATGGSITESGKSKGISTGHSAFTASSIGTTYPVLAITKAHRDAVIQLKNFDIFIASADQGVWSIQINPTLSSAFTYTAIANSSIEYAIGAGSRTVTANGTIIATGNIVQGQSIPQNILTQNFLAYIGGNVAGVQDKMILCFTPSSNNVSIRASMNMIES